MILNAILTILQINLIDIEDVIKFDSKSFHLHRNPKINNMCNTYNILCYQV
jgi:hypothetical protein